MTPIPPPTDNLYKFMAISGLVVLCLSIGFPFVRSQDARIQAIRANNEAAVLNLESEQLKSQVTDLQKLIDAKPQPANLNDQILISNEKFREHDRKTIEHNGKILES